jgi:hypothetical protein
VFAIRTMFWWGNFFSVTLHMKGNYREHFQEKLIGNYALVRKRKTAHVTQLILLQISRLQS